MWNRISLLIFALIIGFGGIAWSLRVPLPPILSNPITDDQVATLNNYLKNIWDIQNGRFEIDTVSSSKSSAKNGELWILTSPSPRLQFKSGGTVYTLIP